MDQNFPQRPPEGSVPSAAVHSFPSQQNGMRPIPEDLDSALRFTPLASVVPASGGISPFFLLLFFPRKENAEICSFERSAFATVRLFAFFTVDGEQHSDTGVF